MKAQEALPAAVRQLQAACVPEPVRDARLLLAHAMGIASDRLTLHLGDHLTPEAARRFQAALSARAARQPVSQILGQRLFWGRAFRVTPDVLDPRPETEALIAVSLAAPFRRLLDLGTGSGAILLTLLAERPEAEGLGVDLSAAALAIAQDNATRLDLGARVAFQRSDWFTEVRGRFDLITCNPPYIAEAEMPGLAPEVRDWEPDMALTPGPDGLAAYRILAREALSFLAPGGRLVVEIGASQGQAVADLFHAGGLAQVRILPDLDGRDRVVCGLRG